MLINIGENEQIWLIFISGHGMAYVHHNGITVPSQLCSRQAGFNTVFTRNEALISIQAKQWFTTVKRKLKSKFRKRNNGLAWSPSLSYHHPWQRLSVAACRRMTSCRYALTWGDPAGSPSLWRSGLLGRRPWREEQQIRYKHQQQISIAHIHVPS